MELNIEIETQDDKLSSSLFETSGKLESGKTQKTLGEDVTIRYEGEQIALAEAVPTVIRITMYIGERVLLHTAAYMLSRYLYDKLRARRDNNLKINDNQVNINVREIEQLIINISSEEHERTENE